jgi:raffinose/stachyose/melibiose transport system substrate-binding protein
MKFSGKFVALLLLGTAYAIASYLALRRQVEEVRSDRVTIRISQWQLEGGVRDAIDAIIRRYEELNPRVHVIQIAAPDRVYLPWIQTQMVGGTGPDLAEYSWPWPDTVRNFAPITAEVMQPNPYNRGTPLEGVPWRDTFIDGMTSPDNYVQSLSQYYGVSMTTGMSRIVYNRSLLKTIMGRDAPPRTYREFLAMCERIKAYAREHGLKLAPLANSRTTHITLTNEVIGNLSNTLSARVDFLHSLKLDPRELGLAYLRGEWSYDAPELVAGFEELREIGAVSTPGFLQRERDSALTDFVSVRSVMVVAPSWEATSLQQLCAFDLGAFRFPFPQADDPVYGHFAHGPFSEGQVTTGMPFYLNRWSKHRAEALDFLRFMSSQEGSTIFTRVSNWLPIVVGVKPSDFAAQFQLQPEGYNWFAGYLGPSNHLDPQSYMLSILHKLWGSDGSVAAFRQAMREGMGEKVSGDLRRDVSAGLDNVRREDSAGAALRMLAPPDRRPETLRLVTLPNEIGLYQSRAVLAAPGGSPP